MLHRECGTPIKQKRYCPQHDRELEPDEIVKGWEVAKGQFVLVEDADLEALDRSTTTRARSRSRASSTRRRSIPIFFDRTYFLVPAQAPAARRPYVLLLNAMRESGMAAIGRFVRRGRETLCLIRPKGDALALETLYLAEDVYSQAEIEEAVEETEVKQPELELAQQVIASLAGDFDPAELQSDYRRDLTRAARGEARRRGDHGAGAGRGRDAGDRPDGSAARERGRGAGKQPAREAARPAQEGRARPRKTAARQQAPVRAPDVAAALVASAASRRAPGAGPGTASCRSCPGRSARLPRRRA